MNETLSHHGADGRIRTSTGALSPDRTSCAKLPSSQRPVREKADHQAKLFPFGESIVTGRILQCFKRIEYFGKSIVQVRIMTNESAYRLVFNHQRKIDRQTPRDSGRRPDISFFDHPETLHLAELILIEAKCCFCRHALQGLRLSNLVPD